MNNRYPTGTTPEGQVTKKQPRFFRPDNAEYNDMRQVMQGQNVLNSHKRQNNNPASQITQVRKNTNVQNNSISPFRRQIVQSDVSPNITPLGRKASNNIPSKSNNQMTPMSQLNLKNKLETPVPISVSEETSPQPQFAQSTQNNPKSLQIDRTVNQNSNQMQVQGKSVNEQMMNDFSQYLQKVTPSNQTQGIEKEKTEQIPPPSIKKEVKPQFIEAPVRNDNIAKQNISNISKEQPKQISKDRPFIEAPVKKQPESKNDSARIQTVEKEATSKQQSVEKNNTEYQIKEEAGRKYIEPPKRKQPAQNGKVSNVDLQITDNDPAIEESKKISDSELEKYTEAAKNPHLEKTFRYSIEKIGLFNFGALFLTPIWAWGNLHSVVGVIILLIPILAIYYSDYRNYIILGYISISVILSCIGNFLSWRYNDRYLSADEFKEIQLKWSVAGIITFVIFLMLYIILIPGNMLGPVLQFFFPNCEFT